MSHHGCTARPHTSLMIAIILVASIVEVVVARTATRTPDELVCLPMVVDYEGYAVMAGLVAGVIAVVIYIAIVRREGQRDARKRLRLEADGYRPGDEDTVYEQNDHANSITGDERPQRGTDNVHSAEEVGMFATSSSSQQRHTASERRPNGSLGGDAPIVVSLDNATDPAVREAMRQRVADEVPEAPPRR